MDILMPRSTQYGKLDKAAIRLAELLAKKPEVAALCWTFRSYQAGTIFDGVEGPGFRIRYGRPQGRHGNSQYNDCGALSTVVLGRAAISLYEDMSGPAFRIHVGPDWDLQKEEWLKYPEVVNTKLYKKPKFALKYRAQDERNAAIWYHHGYALSRYLVNDNDLNREYDADPAKGETLAFHTDKILDLFADFLTDLCDTIEKGKPVTELSERFSLDDGMKLCAPAAYDESTPSLSEQQIYQHRFGW